ncbi:hypothetical protein FHS14_003009 [Paenibacillus baekrokdamisoli]|nr:hypothetical protein [Paenibacillus baekrokdamisoli]MBB3070014.1 hypothetical protein [Paenibacillus baekrokdamisoli]
MNKKRIYVIISLVFLLTLIILYIRGCNPTKEFDAAIESIEGNRFIVNCSHEVVKGMKGPINDIGYGCNVQLTDTTKLQDAAGKTLQIQDYKHGDTVHIILKKRQYINQKHLSFEASKIILLHKE